MQQVFQLGFRQASRQVRANALPPLLEALTNKACSSLTANQLCQTVFPVLIVAPSLNLVEARKLSLKGEASYPYSLTKSNNSLNTPGSKPMRLRTAVRFAPTMCCSWPFHTWHSNGARLQKGHSPHSDAIAVRPLPRSSPYSPCGWPLASSISRSTRRCPRSPPAQGPSPDFPNTPFPPPPPPPSPFPKGSQPICYITPARGAHAHDCRPSRFPWPSPTHSLEHHRRHWGAHFPPLLVGLATWTWTLRADS